MCDGPGSSLELEFVGAFLSVLLPPNWHDPGPLYGTFQAFRGGRDAIPLDAALEVSIDGGAPVRVSLLTSPLAAVVFRADAPGRHVATVRLAGGRDGVAAIEAFRVGPTPFGQLRFGVKLGKQVAGIVSCGAGAGK